MQLICQLYLVYTFKKKKKSPTRKPELKKSRLVCDSFLLCFFFFFWHNLTLSQQMFFLYHISLTILFEYSSSEVEALTNKTKVYDVSRGQMLISSQ